eukprot:TRINITY_DN9352_c0_g1_i1.p1 TRINITY_DN9352_c0_g1~~TRINITY_DN9352_c0_g1_i1.p1  ORF type:complete len:578 (+),score=186.97 TRINITY_DN9352_c0_g1_i1:113-1846(+)
MMDVGDYLVARLSGLGVTEAFGVPGDYAFGLCDKIAAKDGPMKWIGCCNELNAGYAADGYSRVKGLGVLVVTFNVGAFSAMNAISGAMAERVPVVCVCGAPSLHDVRARAVKHHVLGEHYDTGLLSFRQVTVESVRLECGETAPDAIDKALIRCLKELGPVYIEVPMDVVNMKCRQPGPWKHVEQAYQPEFRLTSDRDTLNEALDECRTLFKSGRVVLIAGLLIGRFRLKQQLRKLLDATGWPCVVLQQSKSLVDEHQPQFAGLYAGAMSEPAVQQFVEQADVIFALGAIMDDFDLGSATAQLDTARLLMAERQQLRVKHHVYRRVMLPDLMDGLLELASKHDFRSQAKLCIPCGIRDSEPFGVASDQPLTQRRFFQRVQLFLGEGSVLAAETGVALSGSVMMRLPPDCTYIAQPYYGSIGYAVGGFLGAAVAATAPHAALGERSGERQCVLLVGDGAFQVAAQEISTMSRCNLASTVFVLNNEGYTIERLIHEGSYNDIADWRYHELPRALGTWRGYEVRTEAELDLLLTKLKAGREPALVEVHLACDDVPDNLRRMAAVSAKTAAEHGGYAVHHI